MATINELLEDGVHIEGKLCVSRVEEDDEFNGEDCWCGTLDAPWAEREIKYLYATPDGFLHIELDRKE